MFDNANRAAELGDLAVEMITTYGVPESRCKVTNVAFGYLFPWTRSWKECVQTLMSDGFSFGIEHGQNYPALRCLALASGFLRFSTTTLPEAEQIIRENHDETKRFKVSSALFPLTKPSWQMILNMMGGRASSSTKKKKTDPVTLTGKVMDEKESRDRSSTPLSEMIFLLNKLELACQFGSLDRAYHLMKSLEEDEEYQSILKTLCPHFVSFAFWSGVTYLDIARGGGGLGGGCAPPNVMQQIPNHRRILRRAKGYRNLLEKVVENGCEDARPFYLILKADLASFKPSSSSSPNENRRDGIPVDVFDAAVEAALEQGFVGYAGFACERAYASLVRHGTKEYDPTKSESGRTEDDLEGYYSKRMFELYSRWGAKAKIDYLKRKYPKK